MSRTSSLLGSGMLGHVVEHTTARLIACWRSRCLTSFSDSPCADAWPCFGASWPDCVEVRGAAWWSATFRAGQVRRFLGECQADAYCRRNWPPWTPRTSRQEDGGGHNEKNEQERGANS